MAKTPTSPRPPSRRRRRRPQEPKRERSTFGRAAGLVIAAGSAGVVGVGLNKPVVAEKPVICGGALINRWPVKVANDQDALQNKINLDSGNQVYSVTQMNDQVKPGPIGAGGRMEAEKKAYTVHGYLSFYKLEGGKEGDRDYHVVIADSPGDYAESGPGATGHSMVVEFPNPSCFGGKHDSFPHISALKTQITEARAAFEEHVDGVPDDEKLTQKIPVTVTGVAFFDKAPNGHQPTGHAKIWPDAKGKPVVLELHPVTEIQFDNDPDVD